jgi:hypothetical protein
MLTALQCVKCKFSYLNRISFSLIWDEAKLKAVRLLCQHGNNSVMPPHFYLYALSSRMTTDKTD